MFTLLVAATLGQYPRCQTAQTYAAGYGYARTYAPTYAPTYHAPAYSQVKVYAAFVPVAQVDPYRELVGDQYRAAAYAQQRLAADTNLINAVNGFSGELNKFRLQVAQVAAGQAPPPTPNTFSQPPPAPTPSLIPPNPAPSPAVAPGVSPTPVPQPEPELRLQSVTVPSPLQATFTQVVQNRCGKCHTGSSAASDYRIFAAKDQMVPLTPELLQTIDRVFYSGKAKVTEPDGTVRVVRMPPSGPLPSADEYSPVRAFLSEQDVSVGVAAAR